MSPLQQRLLAAIVLTAIVERVDSYTPVSPFQLVYLPDGTVTFQQVWPKAQSSTDFSDQEGQDGDDVQNESNSNDQETNLADALTRHHRRRPYVLLIAGETGFCGGTLITSKHVLTAAHCVSQFSALDLPNLRAYINTENLVPLDSRARVRGVDQIVIHPDYTPSTSTQLEKNDVAILVLTYPVLNVPRMALSPGDNSTGWAATSYSFGIFQPFSIRQFFALPKPNELQTGPMSVVPNSVCAQQLGQPDFLDDGRFLCVNGSGVCQRDSGSPLVIAGRQVGLFTSLVPGCNVEQVAVFTRISPYIAWILSVTGTSG